MTEEISSNETDYFMTRIYPLVNIKIFIELKIFYESYKTIPNMYPSVKPKSCPCNKMCNSKFFYNLGKMLSL